jgi:hypothetical protein
VKTRSAFAVVSAALAVGLSSPAAGAAPSGHVLVQVRHHCGCAATLRAAGGELVSSTIAVWRLPAAAAPAVLSALERRGLVGRVQPDRTLARRGQTPLGDAVPASDWWLAAIGVDRAPEPPGPGKPVTVVDSGVDLTHPIFAGRPNTIALNTQAIDRGRARFHGTAVASLVAKTYPLSVLQAYDADLSGALTTSEVIAGIEAAVRSGPGVINLSLGSLEDDPLMRDAVLAAFATGSIVVAAAGNERELGNPEVFPASLPHVLSVAATNAAGAPASFSSVSFGVDLSAPGEDVPVAVPLSIDPSGATIASGTSFAAPIVAGAAAWVWTTRPELDNTQVFDLLRYTARDIGETGFDAFSGFGVLDLPAALAASALPPDPLEPNEDVYLVKPGRLLAAGRPLLTTRERRRTRVAARLDATEDPSDLYRLYLPPRTNLTVTLTADASMGLTLWGPDTRSVHERADALQRDRVARTTSPARAQTLRVTTGRAGRVVYLEASLGTGASDARYRLSISVESASR